ncbi:hypothetical protein HMH01_00025 [Halovulum dunhuangense]|uniref:Lipoprotein n=1 Tax=Halovulum dunhuangense TaxID=1505036 RepID=A0A849L013_9RHOB|nr:hypothetical protein [Halovulum dunhuangense]NNU78810.1 hypothetical protein [Halovulum dunhuangense]
MLRLALLLTTLLLGACAPRPEGPPPAPTAAGIEALTRGIADLGPGVDPEEAARAARIAKEYSHSLALAYGVTDPPLVHNTKVNLGLRPRGLCYQWADDLQARLAQEGFRTLTLHRAIANADNPFRIDHSTLIVSRTGDGYAEGLVLDPWRQGGVLFWAPVKSDPDYAWQPREMVLARKLTAKSVSGRAVPR